MRNRAGLVRPAVTVLCSGLPAMRSDMDSVRGPADSEATGVVCVYGASGIWERPDVDGKIL